MNSQSRLRLVVLVLLVSAPGLSQTAGPEPLTVRRAVELAMARAPQLSVARAARDAGDASASLARDAFHPSAWLTSTPGYTYGLPSAVVGRVPALVGVEIRQTIYDVSRRSAALQAEATASELDAALAQSCRATIEATVGAYARSFMGHDQVEAAQRRVDSAEAIARRFGALYEEGRRTELDVERTKLQAARARQKLLNARSDRDLDELELKRLIGWPGSAPLDLAGDPEGVIPELRFAENLDAARASDPQLLSLGREVSLLGKSASLESKRWAPIIEASAQYQRLGKFNDYDKYYVTYTPDAVAIGISIGIPLWTGGRFTDTKRQARARLDHAEALLASRETEIEMAVRRAEAAVARSMAQKSLSRRSQGIAAQDLSAAELLARAGRIELTDLDEREIAAADADEETAKANLDSLLERVRLLTLRGELAAALLGAEPPCAMR